MSSFSKISPVEITAIINQSAEKLSEQQGGSDFAYVYNELRKIARYHIASKNLHNTLTPTDLVNELYLKLSSADGKKWNDRKHFFRVAANAIRHIIVDYARRKLAEKRSADANDIKMFYDSMGDEPHPLSNISLVDEALGVLERKDPESAEIIEMRFFVGYTGDEIAEITGLSRRTVQRRWEDAKNKLKKIIEEIE